MTLATAAWPDGGRIPPKFSHAGKDVSPRPRQLVTRSERNHIVQTDGKVGVLSADIDITEATGLLAARCKSS
jgi:hypothetical protein